MLDLIRTLTATRLVAAIVGFRTLQRTPKQPDQFTPTCTTVLTVKTDRPSDLISCPRGAGFERFRRSNR